ncbi:hypothetical protein WOLCODRAFT_21701 [Wolfiporia cocos MD-104 SS10]|uniref:Uncharacterized protein n=1 Tax=Wolfiporia cocos (strain MD-104) TaxID=742152 RepID=A0A2H3J8R0_WOLCO|nr:hypothetical protein WOLCODRAFT_21701 [Wolfiporia cocos MD-104 SS10]
MRSQVLKIVTSLRRHNRKLDQLYSPYAAAETWDQLVRAIRLNTATGSVLDEMIHIQEAGKTGFPTLRFPNVRRIVYNTLGEIPALLRTGVASLPKVTWDADVLPHNPVIEGENGGQDPAFNVEEDNVEEDNENIANLEQEQNDAAPRALTEAELAAAATILSTYRRYRRRRARRDKYLSMPHSANIGQVAALFQEAAHTMQWARRRYRMLFLGSLPNLVVYLECVENYLRGRKDKAKKRLTTAQHEDLEAAQDYLTKISRWIKEAARLHKLLLPKSDFHREGDLEGLEARAREVQQLAEQLPPDTAAKWREDLEFALKCILKPRVAVRTRKKPALNVEDIDPLEVS